MAPTPAIDDSKQLYDELSQVGNYLADFEYQLAKQNALSDQIDTLTEQKSEFEAFKKQFNMRLPFLNDVLSKCNEFCTSDAPKSAAVRQDIFNSTTNAYSIFRQVKLKKIKFF